MQVIQATTMVSAAALVPIVEQRVYILNECSKRINHIYVAYGARERLGAAAVHLQSMGMIPNSELVVTGGYRPAMIPGSRLDPWTTGGVVSVALILDNELILPTTTMLAEKRHIFQELRDAMLYAGFIQRDIEWEYEWGTLGWADKMGQAPILIEEGMLPLSVDQAIPSASIPKTLPVLYGGVAQVFSSAGERSGALLHLRAGHYYARSSHPSTEGLSAYLSRKVFRADQVALTSSGLSACIVAFKALIPQHGLLLYDEKIYYETERALKELGDEKDWCLVPCDFTDAQSIERTVIEQKTRGREISAFFCDNPRNWWLESMDLRAIANVAHREHSLLICDVSLQPLQHANTVADVVVCSLSKYPSLGMTIGGCITVNSPVLGSKIRRQMDQEANVMSPDAAATIWSQACSLYDRMNSLSGKVQRIADSLLAHPAVRSVRVPDTAFTGGLLGGQLAFHVLDETVGALAERIVGQNAFRNDTALHLVCTFGTAITTFEHFASNVRHREGVPREDTNEAGLPNDIVRIGVGCETADSIIGDLDFILSVSLQMAKSNLTGAASGTI